MDILNRTVFPNIVPRPSIRAYLPSFVGTTSGPECSYVSMKYRRLHMVPIPTNRKLPHAYAPVNPEGLMVDLT
jgi:hypothetical protein